MEVNLIMSTTSTGQAVVKITGNCKSFIYREFPPNSEEFRTRFTLNCGEPSKPTRPRLYNTRVNEIHRQFAHDLHKHHGTTIKPDISKFPDSIAMTQSDFYQQFPSSIC